MFETWDLDFGYRVLDFGLQTLWFSHFGTRALDFGFWIKNLDLRFWSLIPDAVPGL